MTQGWLWEVLSCDPELFFEFLDLVSPGKPAHREAMHHQHQRYTVVPALIVLDLFYYIVPTQIQTCTAC